MAGERVLSLFLLTRRSTSTTMGSLAVRNASTASSWVDCDKSWPFTCKTTHSINILHFSTLTSSKDTIYTCLTLCLSYPTALFLYYFFFSLFPKSTSICMSMFFKIQYVIFLVAFLFSFSEFCLNYLKIMKQNSKTKMCIDDHRNKTCHSYIFILLASFAV